MSLHLRLWLTCGKLVILQSNLVWAVLGNSYNMHTEIFQKVYKWLHVLP